MIRTVLGRMKRVTQQPFARAGYNDPVMTSGYSRNSTATVIDQQGNVVDSPINTVRRSSTQYIGGNLSPNPNFIGFNANVDPVASSMVTNGAITKTRVGAGVEDGIPYVDFRLSGTNPTALQHGMFFADNQSVPAVQGQTMTGSVYARVVGGSLQGIIQCWLNMEARSASAAIGGNFFNIQPSDFTSGSLRTQRRVRTVTFTDPTTAYTKMAFLIDTMANVPIDVTFRIGGPQVVVGTAPLDLMLPPAGSLGPTVSYGYNRMLVEPSATNQAVNSLGTGLSNTGAHASAVSTDFAPPYAPATVYKGTKQVGVGDNNYCNTAGGTYAGGSIITVSCYLLIPVTNTATVANISQDSSTALLAQRSYDMSRKGTWQRISSTITTGATANAGFQLRITGQTDGDVHYRCMLQIENGYGPTSYVPTSAGAVQRNLDAFTIPLGPWYFDGPKYTNLIPNSNFNPAAGNSVVGGTLTNNAATGPFGGTVANSFVTTVVSGTHSVQGLTLGQPYVAGRQYTYSVYLKQLGTAYRYVHMRFPLTTFPNTDRAIIVDLQTGTIAVKDPTVIARVSTLPGGWFRVIMTQTCAVGGATASPLIAQNNTNDGFTGQQSFTGNGTDGFYLYGGQMVEGTSAGPYIDNPTATLNTKSPSDNASFLFRGVLPYRPYVQFTGIMTLDNQTFDNRFYVYADTQGGAGTQVWMMVAYGGAYNGPYPIGTLPAFGTEFTVNVAISLTQVRASVNGGAVFTLNTPVPINAFTKLSIGSIDLYPSDGSAFNGEVTRFEYVPYLLSDNQLMTA